MIFLLKRRVLPLNNFFIILIHTYVSKLKTKSFLVTTVLTALILVTLTNIPRIIDFFEKDGETDKIAVIDESGQLFVPLEQQLLTGDIEVELVEFTGSVGEAEEKVEAGEYAGLLQL